MPKPKKDTDTFREQFDPAVIIPNKIKAALASLAKDEGPAAWDEEIHFLKRASLNAQTIAPHRETFKAHIVEAKKNKRVINVWFVDPKAAAEMRKKLG